MRVSNPIRFNRCGCEHQNHFTDRWPSKVKVPRIAHRYMKRPADGPWAMYVGHVCVACAESCMREYMIADHVCGDGDCSRGDGDRMETEMERWREREGGRRRVYSFASRRMR